jgi:hypothetical protein
MNNELAQRRISTYIELALNGREGMNGIMFGESSWPKHVKKFH